MAKNPVGWFEIYVDDMERAKAFYEQVLQIEFERLNVPDIEMWSFPYGEGEGISGALVKADAVQAGGNSTMVYFSCDDCAVEEGRVEAAGGTVQQPKFSIGEYGFCSLAVDTEGNCIGLHSRQ